MTRPIRLALLALCISCGATTTNTHTHTHTTVDEGTTVTRVDGPPIAAVRPVTDTYHGEEVVDPYQWLERPDDAAVRAWSDGQNAYARRILDAEPNRDAIRARIEQILTAPTRSHRNLVARGSKIFAIETRPPREQPMLVVMDSVDAPDDARILVDPQALDAEGHTAIDWFEPSNNGRLVAVSLSQGGSERGDVHVYDVTSGEEVHETVAHVHNGTAGGDLAWLPDDSGFFYTRYPREGDEHADDDQFHQQLWFHTLGTEASADTYELGRDLPRIAEIQVDMHASSGRLMATVQKGDGGEFAMFLREPAGTWTQFSTFEDGVVQAVFGPRNDLYVVSRHEHPRGRILHTNIRGLDLARATEVVAEGTDSIVTDFWEGPTVWPTPSRLYVMYQTGGPSELRVFDHRGRPQTAPTAPPVSAVRRMVPLAGEALLYQVESFVTPPVWMRLARAGAEATPTALQETSPVDVSGWEVRREMATSADGTQVPLNILLPRGLELDGSHPCIITGYGGYGVNIEPRFRPMRALNLDNGIITVVANLRGGTEFGEEWHTAGNLTNKQNVFDDFAAVMQHMVERNYTSSERLGIIGGSNGGLLMGAMLTQHPDMMAVVVSFVGIYDMLRVELSPNGAFNVTEFGTVQDEAQYRALRAYSPYHNIDEGVAYPATLFLTGANDPRVEPWHSRKMTARLQVANSGDEPILLRTSDTSGHGIGTSLSEEIEEETDVTAFLFAELGVTPQAVSAPQPTTP